LLALPEKEMRSVRDTEAEGIKLPKPDFSAGLWFVSSKENY
jgi:hypothetical protein